MGSKFETIDHDLAKETAEHVSHFYDRLILRFGASGCDKQILVNKRLGRTFFEETGHSLAPDKRGYGDILAIQALRDFFEVLPKG